MQGLALNKQTTSFRAAIAVAGIKQTDNIIQSRQCRGWHQTNRQHHSEPSVQGLASNKQTTSFRAVSAGAGIKQTHNIIHSIEAGVKQTDNIIQSRQCRGWHQTNRQHHSEPSVQGLASNKQTTSFIAVRLASNKHTTSFRAASAGAGIKQTYNIIQSRRCMGWHQTNRQHHSEPQ